MKKLAFTIAVLLSLSFVSVELFGGNDNNPDANRESSKISGYVLDKNTGESLSGVKIMVAGTNNAVYTNIDGYFEIENKAGKNSTITADMVSYKMAEINNASENVHIELSPKTVIE